jgi:hypothetical protein
MDYNITFEGLAVLIVKGFPVLPNIAVVIFTVNVCVGGGGCEGFMNVWY